MVSIGTGNELPSVGAITWTNADLLSVKPHKIHTMNFSMEIQLWHLSKVLYVFEHKT